jgi:Protein of unknown function (DUF3800)
MVDVFCDESYDGQNYALGGWIAAPHGWGLFNPRWRSMLNSQSMPDGSPMSAFHTAEIVNRDLISGSRFKGWTFDQEKAAFAAALDVIWHLLFTRFILMIVEKFQAFNGFTFTFDSKPEVKAHVDRFFAGAFAMAERAAPGKFASSTVRFGPDETEPGLQAADLLMYEWRRFLSDRIAKPGKSPRRSYLRLREVCPTYSELHHLSAEAVAAVQARRGASAGTSLAANLLTCPMVRT